MNIFKMTKQAISLLLCVALIVTMLPMGVLAVGTENELSSRWTKFSVVDVDEKGESNGVVSVNENGSITLSAPPDKWWPQTGIVYRDKTLLNGTEIVINANSFTDPSQNGFFAIYLSHEKPTEFKETNVDGIVSYDVDLPENSYLAFKLYGTDLITSVNGILPVQEIEENTDVTIKFVIDGLDIKIYVNDSKLMRYDEINNLVEVKIGKRTIIDSNEYVYLSFAAVGCGESGTDGITIKTINGQPANTFRAEDGNMDIVGAYEVTHLTEVPKGYIGIYTKEDLDAVRRNRSGKYILMNDIIFTEDDFVEGGTFYNDGKGWEPIGKGSSKSFDGTFDGNGYTIKNLYVNMSDNELTGLPHYSGLFGFVLRGTIKNLGMVDSYILGALDHSYAGSIVGYADNSKIINCYNTGDVMSSTCNGGIAGVAGSDSKVVNCYNIGNVITDKGLSGGITGGTYGKIANCYNKGAISATWAGGIANNANYVENCYNTGEIVGRWAGGIVAKTSLDAQMGNKCSIDYCYNTGTVVTFGLDYDEFAGGIVGSLDKGNINHCYNIGIVFSPFAGGICGDVEKGNINDCYNTGSVIAYFYAGGITSVIFEGNIARCYNNGNVGVLYEDAFVGGIAGFVDSTTAGIVDSYYLDNVSVGVADGTDGGTKCTLEEMQNKETFRAFDFEYYWYIDEESDYKLPQIINNPHIKTLSIKITVPPDKLTYVEGQEIDVTGMLVEATFENGVTQNIGDVILDYDTSVVGTQIVTVIYGGKTDTFEIVVTSAPSSITSYTLTVSDNNISKIKAGTTVNELLANLNEGNYCKVFKEETEVTGDSTVGTGMTVKIMAGTTVKATYTIIVTGDTNGDGKITVTDMLAIKSHVLKKTTLSGVYAQAADTSGDGGISITDFIQVKANILGKGEITAR